MIFYEWFVEVGQSPTSSQLKKSMPCYGVRVGAPLVWGGNNKNHANNSPLIAKPLRLNYHRICKDFLHVPPRLGVPLHCGGSPCSYPGSWSMIPININTNFCSLILVICHCRWRQRESFVFVLIVMSHISLIVCLFEQKCPSSNGDEVRHSLFWVIISSSALEHQVY